MKETSEFFDRLQVTEVHVFPFRDAGNLGHIKGLARVVLNDQLEICGIRIMEGENGMFIGFPIDPFYRGEEFRSVVSATTSALHDHIEKCVLEKFNYAKEHPDGEN